MTDSETNFKARKQKVKRDLCALVDLASDDIELTHLASGFHMLTSSINSAAEPYTFPVLDDDEPFFILCGRDHLFVPLVEAWANLRSGHVTMGKNALDQVYTHASQIEAQSNSDPQIISAFHKANEGRLFLRAQALKPNPVTTGR